LNEKKNELLRLLLGTHSIEEVVETIGRLTENPVVFIDINFTVRGVSGAEKISALSWLNAIDKGFCSHEFIFEIVNTEQVKRFPKERTPYVVSQENGSHALVSPLIIRDKYAGALVMFFDNCKINNQQSELLLLANEVLTEIILKVPIYKYIRGTLNEGILMDLIEGRDKENPDLKSWIMESELNKNDSLCVLVAEQSNEKNYQEVMKDSLKDDLYHTFPKSHGIFYGNKMVILCVELKKTKCEEKIKGLKSFINKHSLKMGMSQFFQGIENFQHYYLQAGAALDVGGKIEGLKQFYRYDEYRFFHLLEKVAEKDENCLQNFVQSNLFALKKYDRLHQTELFDTLNMLMLCGCNYKKTCQKLHIHRNTLSYRLERIKELTDLNLSDPEVQFDLGFSFRILSFSKR
jgi:hypothetical protein